MKKTKYIIMTRCPQLSGKAAKFGVGYRKIALVQVDPDKLPDGRKEPAMISERSRGVVSIEDCRTVYWGEGVRSEGRAYRDQLEQRAQRLNR